MRPTALCLAALAAGSIPTWAATLRLSGPYVHDNLSIYLVHGQDRVQKNYLTLAEAIEQRKVVVHETGHVNQLQVENLSRQDVYIQSGEIVKGGKQDRVLSDDIILPPTSGKVDVKAFCVEHGRWTQRGGEAGSESERRLGGGQRGAGPSGQDPGYTGEVAGVGVELSAHVGSAQDTENGGRLQEGTIGLGGQTFRRAGLRDGGERQGDRRGPVCNARPVRRVVAEIATRCRR